MKQAKLLAVVPLLLGLLIMAGCSVGARVGDHGAGASVGRGGASASVD